MLILSGKSIFFVFISEHGVSYVGWYFHLAVVYFCDYLEWLGQ